MRWIPLLALAGCLNLDGFAFNPVHCSNVTAETCDDNPWDAICASCDEPYDWARSYPWFPTMLGAGESVRPITDVVSHTIPSTDGLAQLDAYFIPSHGDIPELAGTTLLYNHGNYAGIEPYVPRVQVLHELGYNVLIWDYRGFGKSLPDVAPTPTEFLADARQLRAFVSTVAPDPDRVIVYGYSLGGVPAVEAALAEPPCALILEAPFTSASAIAEENGTVGFPESFLSEGLFDNIRKIEGVTVPVFAMVGTEDTRFPPSSVQRIVDNAGGVAEIWILEGANHGISDGGIVEAGMGEVGARMRGFIDAHAQGCL